MRCVAHHEIEGAGRDFAKIAIAVKRNGNADGWVIARENHSAFEQAIINLIDM